MKQLMLAAVAVVSISIASARAQLLSHEAAPIPVHQAPSRLASSSNTGTAAASSSM
jgi:hypothetical protein